jgi:hypothetical protein
MNVGVLIIYKVVILETQGPVLRKQVILALNVHQTLH